MTDARIYSTGTLLATAEDRTFRALLVPYGEECSSNLGRFKVDTGAFSVPADLAGVAFNVEHEREAVAGQVVAVDDIPGEGLWGSVYFAKTEQGDAALSDLKSGRKRAVSAEVADVVIRGGQAVAGRLFGAAQVAAGAFPSATLLAAAVDTPDEQDGDDSTSTTAHEEETFTDEAGVTWRRVVDTEVETAGNKTTTTTTVVEETEPADESDTEEEDAVSNATAPSTLTARRTRAATPKTATPKAGKPGMSFREVMAGLHAIKAGHADRTLLARLVENAGPNRHTLFAALSDVHYTSEAGADPAVAEVINPFPQWIGELWDGLAYERDVVDVLNTAPLTALEVAGWQWATKPAGGTYRGNKRGIPSNTPKAVPAGTTAEGWAGGHDHDNRYRHFSNPEYWESYYQAMRENYAEWSNEKALNAIISAATATVADPVPGDVAAGLSYLVDGIASVVDARAIPTFAFVETKLWKGILKTTSNHVLGYLDAALGFESGTLESSGFKLKPRSTYLEYEVDDDTDEEIAVEEPFKGVLVGARQAATFHELPGVPIRVEAEDIARGGVDTGLFGYEATQIHKAGALVHVTPTP
ncbi:MAG: hypothetical protein QM606_05830 [Leucobacter sp.]